MGVARETRRRKGWQREASHAKPRGMGEYARLRIYFGSIWGFLVSQRMTSLRAMYVATARHTLKLVI